MWAKILHLILCTIHVTVRFLECLQHLVPQLVLAQFRKVLYFLQDNESRLWHCRKRLAIVCAPHMAGRSGERSFPKKKLKGIKRTEFIKLSWSLEVQLKRWETWVCRWGWRVKITMFRRNSLCLELAEHDILLCATCNLIYSMCQYVYGTFDC